MALSDARLAARLPATDIERARRWYADKLGLDPVEKRPGGVRYVVGGAEFAIYESGGRADGSFIPGLETVDGIAEIDGNYPSKGNGERAAWFRDSEGNMLAMGQPTG